MTAAADLEIARVRLALAGHRCDDPSCPGWAIFDAPAAPRLEACDTIAGPHVADADVARLPEAVAALAAAGRAAASLQDGADQVRRPGGRARGRAMSGRPRAIGYVIEEPSGHVRATVTGRSLGEADRRAHEAAARYRRCDPGATVRVTVAEVADAADE